MQLSDSRDKTSVLAMAMVTNYWEGEGVWGDYKTGRGWGGK